MTDRLRSCSTVMTCRNGVGMIQEEYGLGDIIEMKKEHPCRKSKYWKITRMGADIKVKCEGCGAVVMFPRYMFDKKIKRIIQKAEEEA